MKLFLSRYGEQITASISGFDRLVFRGTLRRLAYTAGLFSYLCYKSILLKDFKDYAQKTTESIRAASAQKAESAGREIVYLPSSRERKEEVARHYLEKDGSKDGLICVLSCVEPCKSFEIHRSREKKKLELRPFHGKCLHLYHYFDHPDFGLMHVRIQTWFPFTVRICLNGREWLARQLDRANVDYRKADNCLQWIDNSQKAQALLDRQLRSNWPKTLDKLLKTANPTLARLFVPDSIDYYWSTHQMEWATDLLFDSPSSLRDIYPRLTQHAMTQFSSPDVMRFLGRKSTGHFNGEVVSDYKDRPEGVRVKHRVNKNSVKIYDKQHSVLRVETTINDPRDFKAYRKVEGDPQSELRWRPMRSGVADLHRLSDVCQKANERYLDALASADTSTQVKELVKSICRPADLDGRRVRALRPLAEEDASLFKAVNDGEFVLSGFRNRDIVRRLYSSAAKDGVEKKRHTARITRLLRILRAHGLIKKIPTTHRYQVTDRGRTIIAAVLTARDASLNDLIKAA